MNRTLRLLPFAALLLATGCSHPAPAPPPAAAMAPGTLQSPWDTTPVAATAIPFACAPAPAIGPDIAVVSAIEDEKKQLSDQVKSAVYSESSTALRDLSAQVLFAADTYRNTGSTAAAQCVVNLLAEVAQHNGMTGVMTTAAAWEEHSLALRSYAIAWLKVRGAGTATPAQSQLVLDWMDHLSRMERNYYDHTHCGPNKCDLHGHRGHSAATAAAAVGIATNDGNLFHWAVGEYHSAVGNITSQGHLHYDMHGRYALLFNLESAANLVQIAEFGEINGDPLYGYDNGRIHYLVHQVALGLIDTAQFKAAAHAVQKRYTPIQPWEVAWASVYNRRFPDPVLSGLLAQVGSGSVDMWGGEPWDATEDPNTGAE